MYYVLTKELKMTYRKLLVRIGLFLVEIHSLESAQQKFDLYYLIGTESLARKLNTKIIIIIIQ